MYPGPEGSQLNHKKSCCRDGVWQTGQKITRIIAGQSVEVIEEPPPFPQPTGIFTNGTHFHPNQFLRAVRELYDRVVVGKETNTTHAMQEFALASLLQERIVVIPATSSQPSRVLFTLYQSLKLGDCSSELIVSHDGTQYLEIKELSDMADAPGHMSGIGPSESAGAASILHPSVAMAE
ncbi:hypothetical protein C8Q70DRAFT_1054261 [Cubamyces menziesii]|nr:hypothetical protein C8Q70DRAFT_1054261 [Cubamyces menziesii]